MKLVFNKECLKSSFLQNQYLYRTCNPDVCMQFPLKHNYSLVLLHKPYNKRNIFDSVIRHCTEKY